MNFFGLGLGLATLLIIGLGFVWVIRGEYYLGYLWWPYVMGFGFLLIATSLFVPSVWGSALLGMWARPSSGVQPNSRNKPCAPRSAGIPSIPSPGSNHRS